MGRRIARRPRPRIFDHAPTTRHGPMVAGPSSGPVPGRSGSSNHDTCTSRRLTKSSSSRSPFAQVPIEGSPESRWREQESTLPARSDGLLHRGLEREDRSPPSEVWVGGSGRGGESGGEPAPPRSGYPATWGGSSAGRRLLRFSVVQATPERPGGLPRCQRDVHGRTGPSLMRTTRNIWLIEGHLVGFRPITQLLGALWVPGHSRLMSPSQARSDDHDLSRELIPGGHIGRGLNRPFRSSTAAVTSVRALGHRYYSNFESSMTMSGAGVNIGTRSWTHLRGRVGHDSLRR